MALSDTDYQLMLGASGLVIVILLVLVYHLSKKQKEECTAMTVMQINGPSDQEQKNYAASGDRTRTMILAPPPTLTPEQQLDVQRARLEAQRLEQEARQLRLEAEAYYQENIYYPVRTASQFD